MELTETTTRLCGIVYAVVMQRNDTFKADPTVRVSGDLKGLRCEKVLIKIHFYGQIRQAWPAELRKTWTKSNEPVRPGSAPSFNCARETEKQDFSYMFFLSLIHISEPTRR